MMKKRMAQRVGSGIMDTALGYAMKAKPGPAGKNIKGEERGAEGGVKHVCLIPAWTTEKKKGSVGNVKIELEQEPERGVALFI